MKLILLAATALFASPVIAQDTTTGATAGTPTSQTAPPTTADPAMTGQMPATDPSQTMPPAGDPGAMQQAPAPGAAMASQTGDPVGGYQPTQPAVSGAATPGGPVTFQAAPPPSQAFPAPAPLENYPVCKKGQYDKCRQRGGK